MINFRNILHNFGFWRMSKKDIEDELKNHIDLTRKTVNLNQVLSVIQARWYSPSHQGPEREGGRGQGVFPDLRQEVDPP